MQYPAPPQIQYTAQQPPPQIQYTAQQPVMMSAPPGYAPYPPGQPIIIQTGYMMAPNGMQAFVPVNGPHPGYAAPPPAQDNNNMPPVQVFKPMYDQTQQTQGMVMAPPQNYNYTVTERLPNHANNSQFPAKIRCSDCRQEVVTEVQDKSGAGTWTWCLILACIFPAACCIPFCVSSCQDKVHSCPNCHKQVGMYEYKVF